MQGLMMDTPLLITEIMRFALQNHADVAVISVTADDPRHRSTRRGLRRLSSPMRCRALAFAWATSWRSPERHRLELCFGVC
jgi:hypothetical protein